MNSTKSFDLEKAIALWRSNIERHRVLFADDKKELESHLRDHIEELIADGQSEERAFRIAVDRLGDYQATESEFRKVFWAKLKYRGQISNELTWRLSMIKNYLKIAFRNLKRNRGYTIINVGGLATAIACCILIFLYVQDELAFDSFHSQSEHTYRVIETRSSPDQGDETFASTMATIGPAAAAEFPEVVQAVRFIDRNRYGRNTVTFGANRFYEGDFIIGENSFFDVFDFELLQGNREDALRNPKSVVITEASAKKYFGDVSPLGRLLNFERLGDLEVTGVLKNPPANSHLDFSMIVSMATLEIDERWVEYMADWTSFGFRTYFVLQADADPGFVESKLRSLVSENRADIPDAPIRVPSLQAMTDIHFGSASIQDDRNYGKADRTYIYIFSLIGLFIVAIACINYMNLATARSTQRSKEVGMRKVVGANRKQLVGQFLGESILITSFALLLALLFSQLALPGFNGLAGKDLALDVFSGPFGLALLCAVLVLGLLSGSYPAFYLSRFKPAHVLKGSANSKSGATFLRRSLVVAQFALSIIMIFATTVVYKQMRFVKTTELGFNQDQLMTIDINSGNVRSSFQAVKESLAQVPGVQAVTVSSRVPGEWKNIPEIEVTTDGQQETDRTTMNFIGIDEDFVDAFQLEVVDGRNFSADFTSDSTSVLLNETAARMLGVNGMSGSTLRVPDRPFEARIVGVVRDFNFRSLHEPIGPLVLGYRANPIHAIDYFTVRLVTSDMQETLAELRAVGEQFDPEHPFEYNFLDERLADFYVNEQRAGMIFGLSSMLAIIIACLGLFSLAAFTAEQRTREIGVRKVLGASVRSIVVLMTQDFLKLVAIAIIVATPVAYLAMDYWLSQFAYRTPLGVDVLLLTGSLAALVAIATIAYQSVKAALANPVLSLKQQ